MISRTKAEEIARNLVVAKGVEITGKAVAKRIDGALRGKYLPLENQDFWFVTFPRSTKIPDSLGLLYGEELRILTAFCKDNDSITVQVGMDGRAEVV